MGKDRKTRIGVVTCWSTKDNYGQILQCYAFQNYLKKLGFDVFLIRYLPEYKDSFLTRVRRNLSVRRIKYLLSEERRLEKQEELLRLGKYEQQVRKREFEQFRDKNIISTNVIYHSIDELRNNPPDADAYICGSDQVWYNSYYNKNMAGWFLDFGDARRISYAASIGRQLSQDEQDIFSKYISKFYRVSVREESALSICRKAGRRDAVVTVDPTILAGVETFNALIVNRHLSEKLHKRYLFIYALNIDNAEDLHWEQLKKFSDISGLEVKYCCSSGYLQAREIIPGLDNLQMTVEQWILAIKNAQYVVTSSFHGTVFSLLMHIQFATIPLNNKFSGANDRLITLLKSVGLESRMTKKIDDISSILTDKIDWNLVDRSLDELRRNSKFFLEEALNGI